MRVLVAAALLPLLVAVLPAAGEHEVWFRYTVLGYVTDGRGQARAAERVELVRDRTGFSYLADTDAAGFYVVIARLGDESAGEALTLRLSGITTRLTAAFDPTNHRDERGTRVDVDGTRAVERAAAFSATLASFVGAAPR
ncbi:MAG TPA: hypothetical protein VHZ49_11845 [Methylomirabilota bacterium]|nr:hypothetical protein [Methylomirabilota bacterium]